MSAIESSPCSQNPKVQMFSSAEPGGPRMGEGGGVEGGPWPTSEICGIRGLLTGHMGTGPQLLPKALPRGTWVGQAEQGGSVQARERGSVRCWSNPKAALPPWQRAGSAHLHVRCSGLLTFFFKDYNMLLIVKPGEAGLGARSHLHCFPARLNNSLKITGASVFSSAQWG